MYLSKGLYLDDIQVFTLIGEGNNSKIFLVSKDDDSDNYMSYSNTLNQKGRSIVEKSKRFYAMKVLGKK